MPYGFMAVTLIATFFISVCMTTTAYTSFSYLSFSPNDHSISIYNGSNIVNGVLRLTDYGYNDGYNLSTQAAYTQPIQLWDPSTNSTTNFTTYFEFKIQFIQNDGPTSSSGGLTFFIARPDYVSPDNSAGGQLGLFSEATDGDTTNGILAVEFDTFRDQWDPSDNHVGIDLNSIVSKANKTWSNSISTGDTYGAKISYDEASKTLSVHLQDPQVPNDYGSLNLSYQVDLKEILPEKVIIGFSASTGSTYAVQEVKLWNFSSSLNLIGEGQGNSTNSTSDPTRPPTAGEGQGNSTNIPFDTTRPPTPTATKISFKTWKVALVVLLSFSIVGLLVSAWFVRRRKLAQTRRLGDDDANFDDGTLDDDFSQGTGPKRFSYKDLATATNNFSEKGKLGEGGFGGVYRGFLTDLNLQVAVKKISKGSRQGKKEYASEVKIISRLRHRNLVQLIGWCHEGGEFLLVYEFMPNCSLDFHLFGKKSFSESSLTWLLRYKIANGLASGLLYLHEEWEQCVLHRDIKSSNVMLDSEFNAKLGDFGLARLVDHKLGLQTTALAGTLGYMSPECFITGKASKESDVFSFGVVALEIATGRKAVEPNRAEDEVRLVEWVWKLNGEGRVLNTADKSLKLDFGAKEMECLMVVGLWCAHPDQSRRPSMRQVIQALNFEINPPQLPDKLPVPVYFEQTLPPLIYSGAQDITESSLLSGR